MIGKKIKLYMKKDKIIECQKHLMKLAGVPQIFIDHPQFIHSDISKLDIDWANKIIQKHKNN